MRSDYPNSDLINKVNSDWINKVLLHPELGRADPVVVEDDDDLTPQRDLTVRPSRGRRGLAPAAERFTRVPHPEPGIAVKRMTRRSRRRSVARRVTERLVLGIAALGLGAGVWMLSGFQDARNTMSVHETSTAAQEEAPEIDMTALRSTEPAWLSPETLYATAIAPSLARPVGAPLVVPRLGR
jgi:hypothetical protein